MKTTRRLMLILVAVALALTVPLGLQARDGTQAGPSPLTTLARSFETPPDDARIMMRWWWFGPTVTKDGLARELRTMKAGGIGGVEIQPVYPVVLDDPKAGLVTHPFLSDTFIDHLRSAATTAHELGLRVDLTLGSGWPYGGPQIGVTQAAGRLRVERVPVPPGQSRVAVPDIRTGEQLIAAFVVTAGAPVSPGPFDEVSVGAARVVHLAPSTVAREVAFFVSSRTGMMVKRAALGAEGFVLDHYSREATDLYLTRVGERLMTAFDGRPPFAVFCDSLEVFDSDWTPAFLETFKARRGYDLRPLLPALAYDAGPLSGAVRYDWGITLTELLGEQFLSPMQDWARARGTRFRLQGYGVPPATLTSNAGVDLPEGEGHQWKTVRASRWAASAAHIFGRPVVSSETWTWLHSPVFRASPLDIKVEADLHLLQGINQFIGHGWPYTADGVPDPGWRFYAAGVFNDRNPWWTVMPDLSRYLQRLSYLMRQGQPANDVAVYLPMADAYASFTPGKVGSFIDMLANRVGTDVLASIIEAGFNLDFVDDGILAERGRVEAGRLAIGANRYAAIILPGVERVPPATMRALDEYARGGVQVFATDRKPALAPGYRAAAADHAAIVAASARLFGTNTTTGGFVEQGSALGAALAAKVTPDAAVSAGAETIGVVHRRADAGDIYFVANTSNLPRRFTATFRVAAARGERWDPMNGRATNWPTKPAGPGRTSVELDLAPYESTVLVFPRDPAPAPRIRPSRPHRLPPAIDISRDWQVTFAGRTPANWATLTSWTDDDATRYFSGTAAYERTVDIPRTMVERGLTVRLDFGNGTPIPDGGPRARFQAWLDAPVREAAVVYVNGQRAGSVWSPPYAVDITPFAKPGRNTIRVDVANLAINAMAGHALPDYKLLNLRYGTRFDPQDMDKVVPVPAGLLGPIRLVAVPAAAGLLRQGR